MVLKTVVESNSKKVREKYYLPKLKEHLENKGITFSDFTDNSSIIDKSPSRRAWADGTHPKKGVTKTMANKMSIRVSKVFENWKESLPEEVKGLEKINL